MGGMECLLHKLLSTQDVPSNPKWLIEKQFTKFKSISFLGETKVFCVWEEWSLLHKLLFTQDVPSNHKCLIKKQFAKFESILIYKTKGFCVDCYLTRDHFLKFSAESDENNQSSSKANLPGETILRKYPPDISWISLLSS